MTVYYLSYVDLEVGLCYHWFSSPEEAILEEQRKREMVLEGGYEDFTSNGVFSIEVPTDRGELVNFLNRYAILQEGTPIV